MTEKKEITLNKTRINRNFKFAILSLIFSFSVLLIIALFGEINPSNPQNKYSSDMCYYGILDTEGYCNFNKTNGIGESIQVFYGYRLDGDSDIPTDKQIWYQPAENEQYSIPSTFLSSARKSAEITFWDKLLVIYLPLILSKNFFIWIFFSVIIFFLIKLKLKYRVKFE